MRMSRYVLALGTIATWIGMASAANGQLPQNAQALEGTPTIRVDASQEQATRRKLGPAEAARSQLKIRIVDGQYYWASQGNRPLTVSKSGEFTYLASNEPGHYVRLRQINDRLTYVEHVEMPTGSVTYWGELRIVLGK